MKKARRDGQAANGDDRRKAPKAKVRPRCRTYDRTAMLRDEARARAAA